MGVVCRSVKWKASSFACRLESIVLYYHCLLKSSGEVLYCCSSILTEFCDWSSTEIEVSYRQSIDLALPIDSDRLQTRLLGQSDVSFGVLRLSRRLFRTSYDWSNRLHFQSLARRRPSPCPVSIFFVHGTAALLPSGRDRMETSTFFWLLL